MTDSTLAALEARILGVLVEKQHTVPDTYPLTLNALVAGCNQKTSRDPVMSATESEVLAALARLGADSWIVETSGGRVMRYAHNIERVLSIPAQSVAILATLMLRGPQTSAELRANCERLHRFADVFAVDAFLHELAQRAAGALVVELARAPGARETRWAERMSQAAAGAQPGPAAPVSSAPSPSSVDALQREVEALRRDIDQLRSVVAALSSKLALTNR